MKKTLLWEEKKVNLFLIPGGQSNLLTEVKGVLIIEIRVGKIQKL